MHGKTEKLTKYEKFFYTQLVKTAPAIGKNKCTNLIIDPLLFSKDKDSWISYLAQRLTAVLPAAKSRTKSWSG
ncbi:hypothetical protein BN59_03260 [Legionella massiliensis]|uniref:Uncharacterized protein n=1 Tax=Legionella massiliensis TaxID=1034943 RepID=A0A078KX10_9GAMM|nr:hypothetical protein [Legionella massiliensis]CDZ78945.1 hypothetical protein BN59_03260 [Legionella massiliensis]CEE14683.1 hypothetical protein BN1094_03260 [Legionella massiliensis]